MLKNPSKRHHKNFSTSLKSKMLPMSDEQVEEYIRVLFSSSPRANFETAPAEEWLQFLEKFNQQQNFFILSEQQKKALRPYCVQNPDLEMTPDEFIMLLSVIRNDPSKEEQSSRTATSTPASRNLFSSRSPKLISGKSATGYYDDRASTNHPDDSINHMSDLAKESDYIEENNNNIQDMSLQIKKLRNEKNAATRKLQEYESTIVRNRKEHLERISQLQTRLEKMQIEAEQQKKLLSDQKNKEREKLERIAELNSQREEIEKLYAISLKRQQENSELVDTLREELRILRETHSTTLSKLDATQAHAKEMAQAHEKEKADFQFKFDQEKRQTMEARHALQKQQNENVKLMEIIDRQKFDLDEARSGLRYHSNTPSTSLDKTNPSTATSTTSRNDSEQSQAHERLEAEYVNKLELIKQERDAFQQQLIAVQTELKQANSSSIATNSSDRKDPGSFE
ncbi:hypothetical protein [Parasitella parasitica]|uniref:Uncharacterized protein n=1 Tax=Parasitella parasitica TaxID=35722 RepID=A0A0B7ND15_9FUNG|nr:hypothetical protein [Parasitella parasitica]